MKASKISLNNLSIKNNVFLAPIAGYTDYAIRKLQLECGAGLVFTELVSAKGLIYKSAGTNELLYSGSDIESTAAQIFGSDAYYMRSACESEELAPFKIIDINMGCPVPKVYKNGEGSALLNNLRKAELIIKSCVKSGKTITVKTRIGLKKGDDFAEEFAKMAENAGASMLTIHGRVREDYYSGEPNYDAIYKAKKAVSIPIIANGGIFTEQDANIMLDRTGADGVMLARGALSDPFLVSKLTQTTNQKTLKSYIIDHILYMRERKPDKKVAIEFRKFVPYYFKGVAGIKDLKLKIYQTETTDEIIELIEKNL